MVTKIVYEEIRRNTPKALATVTGGALLTALADGIVEAYFILNKDKVSGKFPFQRPVSFLPPYDDWFFVGGPAALLGIGSYLANPILALAGLGGLLYGLGMTLHHIMVSPSVIAALASLGGVLPTGVKAVSRQLARYEAKRYV